MIYFHFPDILGLEKFIANFRNWHYPLFFYFAFVYSALERDTAL